MPDKYEEMKNLFNLATVDEVVPNYKPDDPKATQVQNRTRQDRNPTEHAKTSLIFCFSGSVRIIDSSNMYREVGMPSIFFDISFLSESKSALLIP